MGVTTLNDGIANGNNGIKVTVCHIPLGDPANRHDICISPSAVSSHLSNHGDYIGECNQVFCSSKSPITPPSNTSSYEITREDFNIYPNPASEILFLDLKNYLDQNISISILNLYGQQILYLGEREVNRPILNIDLSQLQLSDGIYLLSVKSEKGQKLKQFMVY